MTQHQKLEGDNQKKKDSANIVSLKAKKTSRPSNKELEGVIDIDSDEESKSNLNTKNIRQSIGSNQLKESYSSKKVSSGLTG